MVDQTVINFLNKLDIHPEASHIYLCLINHSPQSAQSVSQKTNIPKTTVYRRIEELKTCGLVEEQIDEYKRVFSSTSVDLLNLLVVKKEQEISQLRAQLPNISSLLLDQTRSFDPETKVLFYRGQSGVQQMVWNTLNTKKELVGYSYRKISEIVGEKFYKSWRMEWSARKLSFRDLYSDDYLISDPQKIRDDKNFYNPNFYQSRYIPSDILKINYQTDIYNDIVTFYNWFEGEVFGVEIHNAKIAASQKQLFEIVWNIAKGKH